MTQRWETAITPFLRKDNVVLKCARGHEHIVGDIQVARIIQTPCSWDHTDLHVAARWQGGRLIVEEADIA